MPEASTTGVHGGEQPSGGVGGTVVMSLLLIAVVVGFFYWWHNFRNITGTIESNSPTLGAWTMRPDSCSLSPKGDGVVFTQGSKPALEASVAVDPEGGPAVVNLRSTVDGQTHLLEHDRCGDAQLALRKGEDGLATSGEIIFNCVAGENGTVRGDVKFRNCK